MTLGYNSIPLPGGVGAYEYLYLRIYELSFDRAFILSAMMVTRAISYYLSLIVSGVYTLTYHIILMKKASKKGGDEDAAPSEENILPPIEEELRSSTEDNTDDKLEEKEIEEIGTNRLNTDEEDRVIR